MHVTSLSRLFDHPDPTCGIRIHCLHKRFCILHNTLYSRCQQTPSSHKHVFTRFFHVYCGRAHMPPARNAHQLQTRRAPPAHRRHAPYASKGARQPKTGPRHLVRIHHSPLQSSSSRRRFGGSYAAGADRMRLRSLQKCGDSTSLSGRSSP